MSLEVIKKPPQIRRESKATDVGDKALSRLMVVSAGSGGSEIPAQLTGAGGAEQTRGILGYRGNRVAAECGDASFPCHETNC